MEFVCLYTHQKTKKAKSWKDGVVLIDDFMGKKRLKLYHATLQADGTVLKSGSILETYETEDDSIGEGWEAEFEKHLVQITEVRSALSGNVPKNSSLNSTCEQKSFTLSVKSLESMNNVHSGPQNNANSSIPIVKKRPVSGLQIRRDSPSDIQSLPAASISRIPPPNPKEVESKVQYAPSGMRKFQPPTVVLPPKDLKVLAPARDTSVENDHEVISGLKVSPVPSTTIANVMDDWFSAKQPKVPVIPIRKNSLLRARAPMLQLQADDIRDHRSLPKKRVSVERADNSVETTNNNSNIPSFKAKPIVPLSFPRFEEKIIASCNSESYIDPSVGVQNTYDEEEKRYRYDCNNDPNAISSNSDSPSLDCSTNSNHPVNTSNEEDDQFFAELGVVFDS